ncbi:MAG: BrnT family toxin [Acidobacteriota bacterium]|nr:BrnT family toxin [Acidobacteriota bacterium]
MRAERRRGVSNPAAQLHICRYTIVVTGIRFGWDEAKNLSNQRKHGVSFEEAGRVFPGK